MSSNVSIFPASGRRIEKSKASPQSLPLHSDERLALETYLSGGDGESPQVIDACDRLKVPQNVECTRLAAAVGQVLLHAVQARLPLVSKRTAEQWRLRVWTRSELESVWAS